MLGKLLDLLVQFGLFLALALLVSLTTSSGFSDTAGIVLVIVGAFLIVLGYPALCETFWNGKTVGKAALGLRVRTTEGAPIRFRHAAIRAALGLVDFFVTYGLAATLSVLLTKDSQRLGDLAAGTLVLRERAPLTRTGTAFTFYPRPAGSRTPPGSTWAA